MYDNKNNLGIVEFETLDNIIISHALLSSDFSTKRLLNALVGQPLEGCAGVVQVSADEFLVYRKYAVSNNAVLYLLSLISSQGELLDAEAFLLRAVEEDGSTVVYLDDLKEGGTERFELL